MKKASIRINNGITIIIWVLGIVTIFGLSERVFAVECGSSPTNSCDVTLNTVFTNGVYNFNSTSGTQGIRINANGVTLDCNGSTIYGNLSSGSRGIYINSKANTTIKNCIIYNYFTGIRTDGSSNTTIINSSFYNYTSSAIQLASSPNSTIINISANNTANQTGTTPYTIILSQSNNSSIYNSSFSNSINNSRGIQITSTNKTLISGVTANNYSDAFVYASTASSYLDIINSVFTSNAWSLSSAGLQVSYVNISGNTFSSNTNESLKIYNFTDVNIYNNTVLNSEFVYSSNSNRTNITRNNLIGQNDVTKYFIVFRDNDDNINISYNNFSNTGNKGLLLRDQTNNSYIGYNYFFNSTQSSTQKGTFLEFSNKQGNNTIDNNIFNKSGVAILPNNVTNLNIINNRITGSYGNGDAYNVGILMTRSRAEGTILIQNNTIDVGCAGVVLIGANNVRILNNTFNLNLSDNVLKNVNCKPEPITAIAITQLWKTYASVSGFTNPAFNISDFQSLTSTNISIYNNTFNDQIVILKARAVNNLTHDLNNYWFNSYQAPTYLQNRTDLYISNDYPSVYTTYNDTTHFLDYPVTLTNDIYEGYLGLRSGVDAQLWGLMVKLNLFNTSSSYTNVGNAINNTSNFTESVYNISLFNLTNALAYYDNYSVVCTNLLTCSQLNITLPQNATSYVLNNYVLNQSYSVSNNPLVVSNRNSNTRIIDSTLVDTIYNVSVSLNTLGVVPNSPYIVYPNATSEYIVYVYDSSAGTILFNSTLQPGLSTVYINSVVGNNDVCNEVSNGGTIRIIALLSAVVVIYGLFLVFQSGSLVWFITAACGAFLFITILASATLPSICVWG